MSRWSRRSVLRSSTVALALPLLPSALARRSWADAPTAPVRTLFYYVPNGIQLPWFTPDRLGEGYDLKDIAAPLAPVQADVSLLTGLANLPAEDPVAGDHARGTGSFLTCVPIRRTTGSDVHNGVSVDQVLAAQVGVHTPFPSLQVGITPGGNTGDCTAGYACAYTRNISWATPQTPLPNVTDPVLLFERLFGVDLGLSPEMTRLRALSRASILDEVRKEAATLQGRLGSEDRLKLEQYLTAVREVEQRVGTLGGACEPADKPAQVAAFPDQVDAMTALMVLAFQCDLTRVMTFMLGEAASNQTFDFIGVPDAHHATSHHQNQVQQLDKLVKIGAWEVARFVDLVQRLADTPEGDGRLLDQTLVLWSSEMSDGDQHSHRNLPVLLAGGGGGLHQPGRHVRYTAPRPVADLYLWLLQGQGVSIDRFGADGTRALEDLR